MVCEKPHQRLGSHFMKVKITQKSKTNLSSKPKLRIKLSRVASKSIAQTMSLKKPFKSPQDKSLPPSLKSTLPADKSLLNQALAQGNTRTLATSDDNIRKIKAMRRFYNKQTPDLACNSCSFASSCPQYRAGYTCAFLPLLNSHKIESIEDVEFYLKELLASNLRRAHLTMMMETMSGGQPSLETSEALNLVYAQLNSLHERMKDTDASLEIESDDSSIVSRLFGDIGKLIADTKQASNEVIEVTPIVQSEEDDNSVNSSDPLKPIDPHSPEMMLDSNSKTEEVQEELLRDFSRSKDIKRTGIEVSKLG